jgi:hypothetical protein
MALGRREERGLELSLGLHGYFSISSSPGQAAKQLQFLEERTMHRFNSTHMAIFSFV